MYTRTTQKLLDEAEAAIDAAEDEGRELSATEAAICRRARSATTREQTKAAVGKFGRGGFGSPGAGGPGDAFVASEGFKRIADAASRPSRWSSGPVEVETKATLTEAVSPVVQPTVAPGIVETLYQPLTVADLFGSATTTSNSVRYIQEVAGSVVNAADSVAEGGTKPESTLVFEEVDEPVRKVATFLPVSDEFLEDVPQIQQYLNQRLSLFVRIAEEDQLISGSGTAPDLSGLLARAIGSPPRPSV